MTDTQQDEAAEAVVGSVTEPVAVTEPVVASAAEPVAELPAETPEVVEVGPVVVPEAPSAVAAQAIAAQVAPDVAAPVAPVAPAAPPVVAPASAGPLESAPTWPFAAYWAMWLVFSAATVFFLRQVPAGASLADTRSYGAMILGVLALVATSPLLIIAVWLVTVIGAQARKGAVFVSALVKGASFTFGGVLLWWLALTIVDMLRLGRPY